MIKKNILVNLLILGKKHGSGCELKKIKVMRALIKVRSGFALKKNPNPKLWFQELSPSWPADGDGHKFFHKFAFAPSLTYHMI